MLYTVMAIVRPALSLGVARATLIPTEPPAIAVYALLAWALILVWLGNRGSDVEDTRAEGEADAPGKGNEPASIDEEARGSDLSSTTRGSRGQSRNRGRSGKRERRKLTRAQKRRRGHIDWIQ